MKCLTAEEPLPLASGIMLSTELNATNQRFSSQTCEGSWDWGYRKVFNQMFLPEIVVDYLDWMVQESDLKVYVPHIYINVASILTDEQVRLIAR